MSFQVERSWMYDGWNDSGRHSEDWVRNTNDFINSVFEGVRSSKFGVACPCAKCCNGCRRTKQLMTSHLCQWGFMAGYFRWTSHGEREVIVPRVDTDNTPDRLDDMLCDFGDSMHVDDNVDEEPTPDAKAFYAMLSSVKDPLHDYTKISRFTTVTRLMGIKSQYNLPGECINSLLKLWQDTLPQLNKMPSTLYECKCMLGGLKMPSVKIDACINHCMLYYKDRENKLECDFCHEPRYKIFKNDSPNKKRKPIPQKVLRYLPFLPRLQRLFMEPECAQHMRWHKEGIRADSKKMVHPADGEAWKSFNMDGFADDARNVRLVMSTDGFNPFSFGPSPYSCWPVFLAPLNLPPALCLKAQNIFLSMVIPGPKGPGKKFNVYMEPLFDELQQAWVGVETYDSYLKQNFNMKTILYSTVHDRPAFGMVAGWSTHGGMACYECGEDAQTTWLPNGHKWSWFDNHRRSLPSGHLFRTQRNAFLKDTVVNDVAAERLTGDDVLAYMNRVKANNFEGYGETHHWTHIPKFWELPYFSKLVQPHNIDVMHTEKNVAEAIFNIVLDIPGKTKDNIKARLDQQDMCSRSRYDLTLDPNDKWVKPRAPYCLDRDQKREVMLWFTELKFPDGYVANLKRGVSLEQLKIHGLKSHDYHVFMERLLPIMVRGFVEEEVWEALAELSLFFRMLCAKEIDPAQMDILEKNIVVLICKMEKMFPPGFFDSMEHLMIHLPYQAKMGGPVKYRWMYTYERLIKYVRAKIGNKARVEGSIVESYLVEEISNFTSLYLPNEVPTSRNRPRRYAQSSTPSSSTLSLFQDRGWKIGRGDTRTLSDEEYKTAMIYILTNLAEMDDYVKQFEIDQWRRPRPPSQKELDKLRRNGAGSGKPNFLDWFKTLCIKDASIHPELRTLSRGCCMRAKSYDMYEINGFRFRSEKYEKANEGNLSTRNTGVLALGVDDINNNELQYYGVLKDIIELQFDGDEEFNLMIFDCHWFHPVRGVRHLSRFGLVEVAPSSTNPANEPFVIASQVTQVYYVPYACTSNASLAAWQVAHKVPPLASLEIPNIDDYTSSTPSYADVFQENDLAAADFVVQLGSGLENIAINASDEVVDLTELADINNRHNTSSPSTEHDVVEDEDYDEVIIEDIEEHEDDF